MEIVYLGCKVQIFLFFNIIETPECYFYDLQNKIQIARTSKLVQEATITLNKSVCVNVWQFSY